MFNMCGFVVLCTSIDVLRYLRTDPCFFRLALWGKCACASMVSKLRLVPFARPRHFQVREPWTPPRKGGHLHPAFPRNVSPHNITTTLW